MIGILLLTALSWLLLYLVERKNILALGFLPAGARIKQFLIGFVISGILCTLVQFLESLLKSSTWIFNREITGIVVLNSFFWDIKSVLTEELIFRGALLYLLIQKIGSGKSILISAIMFGIYHWFSYGVLGNIIAMILVFVGTGLMGYAWAWAFSKTRSILLPFGLHLGWNFIYNTIFSKGPLGEVILISQGETGLTDWASFLNFVSGLIIVPIIVLLYIRYFVEQETVTLY
jgi:membrane protease YdiL (CAAX protease family)